MSSKGKASNVVRFPIREFKTKVWIVANRILPYSTWDEEEPTPFDIEDMAEETGLSFDEIMDALEIMAKGGMIDFKWTYGEYGEESNWVYVVSKPREEWKI